MRLPISPPARVFLKCCASVSLQRLCRFAWQLNYTVKKVIADSISKLSAFKRLKLAKYLMLCGLRFAVCGFCFSCVCSFFVCTLCLTIIRLAITKTFQLPVFCALPLFAQRLLLFTTLPVLLMTWLMRGSLRLVRGLRLCAPTARLCRALFKVIFTMLPKAHAAVRGWLAICLGWR